ncbi:MAG: YbaB/EbfC family nucleoid-associated protein [Rhodobacteraceae bacterium]|nr:YbaB/EbfC family nucleoid-associated protein [Paracoccaceae bacterium]
MLKGLGALGDMAGMMKKAQDMQGKLAQLQQSMASITGVGESGAGLIRATAAADGDIKALEIDPSLLNGTQKEVVEDLILAALRDARTKAHDQAQQEMAKLCRELGLPANFKMPF